MANMREILKKGYLAAVGYMPTYKIIIGASKWVERGALTEEDLAEIYAAIEALEVADHV